MENSNASKEFKLYQDGYAAGQEHSNQSKETLERISLLDTSIEIIQSKLNFFIEDSKDDRLEILDRLQRINGSVDNYLETKEKVRELELKTQKNSERIEKNTNSRNLITGGLIVLNALVVPIVVWLMTRAL